MVPRLRQLRGCCTCSQAERERAREGVCTTAEAAQRLLHVSAKGQGKGFALPLCSTAAYGIGRPCSQAQARDVRFSELRGCAMCDGDGWLCSVSTLMLRRDSEEGTDQVWHELQSDLRRRGNPTSVNCSTEALIQVHCSLPNFSEVHLSSSRNSLQNPTASTSSTYPGHGWRTLEPEGTT
eukprot:1913563-Rhodomonas_salina.1